jgi:hypothetical protein
VSVLPKLYNAVLFYILWGTAISPQVTFVKCLETEQRYDKRCRYKVFPAHPPASGNVFCATATLILADLMTWWKFQICFLTGGFFGK